MSDNPRMRTVEEFYGTGFAEEEEFEEALDRSLDPLGFDLLFDLVTKLALPPGSAAMDVGCRDGFFSIELARRYGFTVHGVEPVRRHLDGAADALAELAAEEPEVAGRVRIEAGVAQQLSAPDGSVDLIWCRDVLVHVEDLGEAFREFHRVLRPGGHAVVYQMMATDWLEPAEADRLWPPAGIHASSTDPDNFEAALDGAGLKIAQRIVLSSQWRESMEENGMGMTSRQLLHTARLLRGRADFEGRFGVESYEVMLTNCLWGVYQMIGKLCPRVYVLTR